ncbi:hypothetical protein BGZ70_006914 [Mortierella alpina]|uniref:Ricin B lectin domain-containing protein n=1 Tax=Mortierella alpina TaxID=64518 RepID=A0A9P6M3E2_MORAP|nr:hypothetical protein BGZ70_006914 [Mortierella alpina]
MRTSVPQTALRIKNAQHGTQLYDNKDKGLIPWKETTNPDGFWYITPMSPRHYKIKNQLTGNALYYNTAKKLPISWRDTSNDDGLWEIIPQATGGKFKIRNVLTPEAYLYHSIDQGLTGGLDSAGEDCLWTFSA